MDEICEFYLKYFLQYCVCLNFKDGRGIKTTSYNIFSVDYECQEHICVGNK